MLELIKSCKPDFIWYHSQCHNILYLCNTFQRIMNLNLFPWILCWGSVTFSGWSLFFSCLGLTEISNIKKRNSRWKKSLLVNKCKSFLVLAIYVEAVRIQYSSNLALLFWSSENVAAALLCTWIWGTTWRNRASVSCACPGSLHSSPALSFSSLPSSRLSRLCDRLQTWAKELGRWKFICSPGWAQRAGTEKNCTCLVYHTYLMREAVREECWFMIQWKEGMDLFKLAYSPWWHVGQLTEVSSPEDKAWGWIYQCFSRVL